MSFSLFLIFDKEFVTVLRTRKTKSIEQTAFKTKDKISGICITWWKNIEIEKVRCVFQKSWNDFVVSWFEVIAPDDGINPRSIVTKLAFIYVIY